MTKSKIKLSDLRNVLKEELALSLRSGHHITPKYIFSALKQRGYVVESSSESPISLDQEELGDSLDSQVDRYLADYERNSKTENESSEQLEWRDLIKGMLVNEAPEDDEDASGDDTEASEDMSEPGEEQQLASPPKLSLEDIDVEEFSNDVARLIENYDNLLEVRKTLMRRAVNFVVKNYDEHVVKELKNALRENHGLMLDKTQMDHEDDDFAAPFAGEAGPGGS